jgi:hypothetical protein
MDQGFPVGLAQSVRNQSEIFALRLWIVDNSGSMNAADGWKVVATTKRADGVRWVRCTRFAELQECVLYHAQLSALLLAPTKFILLNAPSNGLPQEMGVAEMGRDMVEEELLSLKNTLTEVSPRGVTPLTQHLDNLYYTVQGMEASLRREGQRVAIILATDGEWIIVYVKEVLSALNNIAVYVQDCLLTRLARQIRPLVWILRELSSVCKRFLYG